MEFFFSNNIQKNIIILDKIESNHCMNVLRHALNDKINIVDGLGNLYMGNILNVKNNECYVKIEKTIYDYNKKDYYVHLAISPTKNHSRIEWFIEKSIEIGVDEISFINCNRTLRKKIRMNRIINISKTAIKQSNKAKLPLINPPVNFSDFVVNNTFDNSFICHLNKNNKNNLFSFKKNILKNNKSCVLIGPEGDFTKEEVEFAIKNRIFEISLGDSILRTETAGVVACNVINVIKSN